MKNVYCLQYSTVQYQSESLYKVQGFIWHLRIYLYLWFVETSKTVACSAF
jgi:hypothetical protein